MLIFIPVAAEELAAMKGEVLLTDRRGYTVTPELRADLSEDDQPVDEEEAEFTAMILASVASLSQLGERRIMVADVSADLVSFGDDALNGEIQVSEVPTDAITCWFSEEDGVDVSQAADQARGLSIDDALEQPAVAELVGEHALLYNDVEEYRRDMV